jgi:hypothetical protein
LYSLVVGGQLLEISNTVFEVHLGGCLAVLGGPTSTESSVSVNVTEDLSSMSEGHDESKTSISTETVGVLQEDDLIVPPPPPEGWDPAMAGFVDGKSSDGGGER